MSRENVERLRRAYEAWNHGNPTPFLDSLHPDVEFHQAPGFLDMGVYSGPKEVASALEQLAAAFVDFRVEPQEIVDLDDGRLFALVCLSGRGRGSGAPFEVTGANLFTPAPDGRLLRFEAYFDRAEALEAAGLRE